MPESSAFFKFPGPEMLEKEKRKQTKKKTAPFVGLESEKEANQAAGRFRFCSITVFRDENKESYNLYRQYRKKIVLTNVILYISELK